MKTPLFVLYFTALSLLTCAPGLFDMTNHIEPWVLGLPFSMFWQFLMAFMFCVGFFAWYRLDDKSGELDLDIEPDPSHEFNR